MSVEHEKLFDCKTCIKIKVVSYVSKHLHINAALQTSFKSCEFDYSKNLRHHEYLHIFLEINTHTVVDERVQSGR